MEEIAVIKIETNQSKHSDWQITQFGYTPITDYWGDFSVVEKEGDLIDVEVLYTIKFNECKNDYKKLTELVMVLNWKIEEHFNMDRMPLAKLYDSLWRKADKYAVDNLKDEELNYFFRTTD